MKSQMKVMIIKHAGGGSYVAGLFGPEDAKIIENFREIEPDLILEDTESFFVGCKSEEEKIEYFFSCAVGAPIEIEPYGKDGYILHVKWGDWKHDHAFIRESMKKLGYREMSENVTESDGSDCYSSDHVFKKAGTST